MVLFDKCEKCGRGHTLIKKNIVGSFIRIRQSCKYCDHVREWNSQPFVKNIPAGNILLSAAILYSGGLPAQVANIINIALHLLITTSKNKLFTAKLTHR